MRGEMTGLDAIMDEGWVENRMRFQLEAGRDVGGGVNKRLNMEAVCVVGRGPTRLKQLTMP